MATETPTQTFDDYLENRNLNDFPDKEFQELEKIEEFSPVVEAAWNYMEDLKNNLGVCEADCNLVAHGIVSHLLTLDKNNERHLAYFLLPPPVAPENMNVLIDSETMTTQSALASWEAMHTKRNVDEVERLKNLIIENPGRVIRIEGCMFSAKTHLMLLLLNEVSTYQINGHPYNNVYAYIFAGLKEKQIRTRVGGPGRAAAVEVTYKREAEPVWFDGLVEKLRAIEPKKGTIVVMEEYTFGEDNPEKIKALAFLLDDMAKKGVTVIMGGLNANFKNQILPISGILEDLAPSLQTFLPKVMCESFTFDPRTVNFDNRLGATIKSDTTIRHDVISGFADMYHKVVIGREEGKGKVEYQTAPANANIFESLKNNDPKLYDHLNSIPEESRESAFAKRMGVTSTEA